MEESLPYLGVFFGFGFVIKILNYSIFDYYKTDLGRAGSFIIGILMFYRKEERMNEKDKNKKVSKLINNICAYVMLAVIGILLCYLTLFLI